MGNHNNKNFNETWLHQQIKDLEYKKKKLNVYVYNTDRKRELDERIKLCGMKVVIRTIYKVLKNSKPVIDYWIYNRK